MLDRVTIATHVDHIVPKAEGGTDDISNLQSLCVPHHQLKTAREGGYLRQPNYGDLRHPTNLPRPLVKVTMVCGPPGSGKSTYVRNHKSAGDIVICFDQIVRSLIPDCNSQRASRELSVNELRAVLQQRNEALASLSSPVIASRSARAWFIVSEPSKAWRLWWRGILGAEVVVMETPAAECRRRCRQDAKTGDIRRDGAVSAIDRWWSAYERAPGEVIISPM